MPDIVSLPRAKLPDSQYVFNVVTTSLGTLLGQRVHVGQGQLACFDLFLDIVRHAFFQHGFQRIARHDRQARVPLRRLLARLDHHTSRFEFDQRVVRVGLVLRDIHHQPRGFFAI